MNAVIYARYSSDHQREESIEGQLKACHEYAKSNGYIVIEEYIDRAATATNDNRAEFQRMISDAENRQVEVVLVFQFDRFARNRYDSAVNKGKLRKFGVRVVSVKENIPDTPSGAMLEGILESLAEYFSADMSLKIRRGHKTNAEKCLYNGGTLPLGYRIDEQRHFQIDECTAPIVKQIFHDYANGKTVTDIINELNAAGLRTVRGTPYNKNSLKRMLRNARYLGLYIYDGSETPGGIPKIIDEDTFSTVQERLKEYRHTSPSPHDYLLTTKLFCGYDRAMMIGVSGTSKTGKSHSYYACKNARERVCNKRNVRQPYIENLVVDQCRTILTDNNIAMIAAKVSELCKREADKGLTKQLEKELGRIDAAIENLMKALECGEEADLLLARIKSNRENKREIEAQIAKEKLGRALLTEPEILFFLTELRSGNADNQKYRKVLINVLVNRIYLYDDNMTIFFNTGDKPVEITADLLEQQEQSQGSTDENSAPPENCR